MSKPAEDVLTTEPRWPIILITLLTTALITSLPNRYQLAPWWFPWVAWVVVIAPMAGIAFTPSSRRLHRIERQTVLVFFAVVWAIVLLSLGRLVRDMVAHAHGYGAITLLQSAVVIWIVNVILFALLYWQLDRSGPEARATGAHGPGDFMFSEAEPAHGAQDKPVWQSRFLDYLFLAFATSTSFTPPDYAKPVSRRAKLLVMMQASTALLTLVLVASRAVATLA